jgi:hypothetical protein
MVTMRRQLVFAAILLFATPAFTREVLQEPARQLSIIHDEHYATPPSALIEQAPECAEMAELNPEQPTKEALAAFWNCVD